MLAASGASMGGIDATYFYKVSDTKVVFAVPAGASSGPFTLQGVSVTSSESVMVNDLKLDTLNILRLNDASGSNGTINLGTETGFTLQKESGDGTIDIISSNSTNENIYAGGSGPQYLHMNGDTSSFILSGIDTEGYGDIEFSFGMTPWKNLNTDNTVTVEYRDVANNGAWTPMVFPTINQQANTWFFATMGTPTPIPQSSNLHIRISMTDALYRMRLDDFSIRGRELPPIVSFNTAEVTVDETIGQVVLAATASKPVAETTTIQLTVSGSLSGAEYTLTDVGGTQQVNVITIAAGETTGSATLAIVNDSEIEDTEDLNVQMTQVTAPVEIDAAKNQVDIYVFDDDSPPTVYQLTSSAEQTTEGDAALTLTAKVTKAVTGDQILKLAVSGTNVDPSEYAIGAAYELTILDGQNEGSVTFQTIDDDSLELSEMVVVSITEVPSALILGDPVPSVTIEVLDNELPGVQLSLSQMIGSESEQSEITIFATTEVPVLTRQTIKLKIDGTGIDTDDYSIVSGEGVPDVAELYIPEGKSTASVVLTVARDQVNEGNEIMNISVLEAGAGIDAADLGDAVSVKVLDEYLDTYIVGPETFGFRENTSIAVYQTNGYFDFSNVYDYTGSARVGKRAGADGFDSYVNFQTGDEDYFQMGGLNTSGQSDLKLSFMLRPTKSGKTGTDFQVAYSLDGETFTNMTLNYPHSGEQTFETRYTEEFLPESENLTVRWTNLDDGSGTGWWLDNVAVIKDNPRPKVTVSVDTTWVAEVQQKEIKITATLVEPLTTDEYVFLAPISGTSVSADDYTISSTIIELPKGSTSGFVTLQVLDDEEEEYGEQLEIKVKSTSSGLDDFVIPSKIVVDVYDNDKVRVDDFFFKETLNNPNNIEPKSWGDRQPPNYLNRSNRPWSNVQDHYLRQHFWNAESLYITGNAIISAESFLGGMSREEGGDFNSGAEKYPGASGAHYFFFDKDDMYVTFGNIKSYQQNSTIQFGMYRFENWASDGTEMKVEISTDGALTWKQLTFDNLASKPGWFLITIKEDLPVVDNLAIRFRTVGLQGSNVYKIDDINIVKRETGISGLSSNYERKGGTFTINGTNFLNVQAVQIGNKILTPTNYQVINSTSIKVTVPNDLQAGGVVKVKTAYNEAVGPEMDLDDRVLVNLQVDKTTLSEIGEESATITAKGEESLTEDAMFLISILGDRSDVNLSSDTLKISKGETLSAPVSISARYDDFISENDEKITVSLSKIINGHVDFGSTIRKEITITNDEKISLKLHAVATDTLYEDARDELVVFATFPFSLNEDFTFDLTLAGTAAISSDYEMISGSQSLTVKKGELFSDSLVLRVKYDKVDEDLENVLITLAEAENTLAYVRAQSFDFWIKDATRPIDSRPLAAASEEVKNALKAYYHSGYLNVLSAGVRLYDIAIYNAAGQLQHERVLNVVEAQIPWRKSGVFILKMNSIEGVITKKIWVKVE